MWVVGQLGSGISRILKAYVEYIDYTEGSSPVHFVYRGASFCKPIYFNPFFNPHYRENL